MKRLIVTATLGYIIGIIYGLCFKTSIALFHIVIVCMIIILRYSFKNNKKTNRIRVIRYLRILFQKPVILVIIILSVISNTYILYMNNSYTSFYSDIGEKIELIGVIESEAIENEYTNKYVVKCVSKKYKNKKFLLYVKRDRAALLEYGDLVKLSGDFKIPETRRNYKGFDYQQYLKAKKIYGSIFTDNSKVLILKKNQINIVYTNCNNIRKNIVKKSNEILPKETSALLAGILIGEISDVSEETIENFRNSSLLHVLAVSGSHITYIIIGLTYIFNKSRLSKRKINIMIIIALILFMVITGFSASVTRACIMGIILLGSKIFYQKQDISTSIALSLLIILTINPFSINDVGLQLSYIGTIGIILFNKNIEKIILKTKINKSIIAGLSVTFSAQILLMPFLMYTFNTLSFVFFVSNIIALPLTGAITLMGFVNILVASITIDIAKAISIILNLVLKILMLTAELTAKIPFSNIAVKTPYLLSVIFYYICVLTVNYIYSMFAQEKRMRKIQIKTIKCIKNINKKKLFIISLLVILVILSGNIIYINIDKDLKIFFVDVSQGDCTIIVTPRNKVVLIDGGKGDRDILVSYLLDRRIQEIDYIIISHFDSDHCNGLIKVIEKLKVKNVIISKQAEESEEFKSIIEIINARKIQVKVVSKGDRIILDKSTYIDMLYPKKELEYKDLNNNSIVCKLVYDSFSCLFTGDIEKSEKDLIELYSKDKLESTILKVSHHGSQTSSGEEFLEAVNPEIALIGVRGRE